MRTLDRRLLVRLWTGVAASLLAGALLAPAPARAGCGDHFRPLQTAAVPTAPGDFAGPAVPAQPIPCPCKGPTCSRAPAVPPLSVPTTSSAGGEHWACPAVQPVLPDRQRARRPAPELSSRPLRPARAVYHPPRSSFASCA